MGYLGYGGSTGDIGFQDDYECPEKIGNVTLMDSQMDSNIYAVTYPTSKLTANGESNQSGHDGQLCDSILQDFASSCSPLAMVDPLVTLDSWIWITLSTWNDWKRDTHGFSNG